MNSVNTNFGSLVAMKNMEKVEKTMQEAMERLSSGLRINHAADDAAGSAIASKMESSVRSLGQAIRNSQDAISMTQTAEGALGEIENILQRMRELSVQAGNSTLAQVDRDAIQKEVKQLATEIDSISNQAHFNGVKLLDGSVSELNFQVGANATDKLTVALDKASSKSLGLDASKGVSRITSERIGETDFSGAKVLAGDVKLNGQDLLAATYEVNHSTAADSAKQLAAAINKNTDDHGAIATAFNTIKGKGMGDFNVSDIWTINTATVDIANSYEELVENINTSTVAKAVLNSDNSITLSNTDGGELILAGSGVAAAGFATDTFQGMIAIENIDGSDITIQAKSVENGFEDSTASTGTIADVQNFGFNEIDVPGSVVGTEVSTTALSHDHQIFINGVKVGSSATGTAKDKAAAINAISDQTGVTADAYTKAVIELDISDMDTGGTEVVFQGITFDLSAHSSVEGVVSTLNADTSLGDLEASTDKYGRLVLESHSGAVIEWSDASTSSVFGNIAMDQHGSTQTSALYGTIKLTSESGAPIQISGNDGIGSASDDLAHIGLVKQSEVEEVTSSGVDVSTLNGAASALAKIDKAIETVSGQRSTFGAVENRLDAVINNLTTLKTNPDAARSRIEDADFAAETSKLTKSQILSQAATSMLAQANASRQNLLALLQG